MNKEEGPIEYKSLHFKVDQETDEEGVFTGIGSGFGDVDQGGDMILNTAFDEDLSSKPANAVKCLWQHDDNTPLGYYRKLSATAEGLHVVGKILPTQIGRDALIQMKGDDQGKGVDGLSIGYRVIEFKMADINGRRVRIIEKAKLLEISVVTFPMHLRCRVEGVKKMTIEQIDEIKSLADVEDYLRAPSPLTREGAKKFVANLKKLSGECESHTDNGLTDAEREAKAKEEQKEKEEREAQTKEQEVTDIKALSSFVDQLNVTKV